MNNQNKTEIHGCIVCSSPYQVLAVYSPDDQLVDCTVLSPDGHCVSKTKQPLVACDFHTEVEIEKAYNRWLSKNDVDPNE